MKKLNKMLLGFGSITTVVAPVAAVVACEDSSNDETKINGKTATEIKALNATDFATFLNETFKKANNNVELGKFTVSTDKKDFRIIDTDKNQYQINVDATKGELLRTIAHYKAKDGSLDDKPWDGVTQNAVFGWTPEWYKANKDGLHFLNANGDGKLDPKLNDTFKVITTYFGLDEKEALKGLVKHA